MIIASLEDLAKLDTPQKVFDHGAKHLLEQNEAALSKYGVCAYRGAAGMACGAGCFIPDSEYQPKIEGASVRGLNERLDFNPEISSFIKENQNLLQDLQLTHDSSPPEYWLGNLKTIAETRGLSTESIKRWTE
jgi:hypothetical protein